MNTDGTTLMHYNIHLCRYKSSCHYRQLVY